MASQVCQREVRLARNPKKTHVNWPFKAPLHVAARLTLAGASVHTGAACLRRVAMSSAAGRLACKSVGTGLQFSHKRAAPDFGFIDGQG